MASAARELSTGLPGLDRTIRGLLPGDNLVWRIDSTDEYIPFVQAACAGAAQRRHTVVYFRFASHLPLLEPQEGTDIYELHPEDGFDAFVAKIRSVIDVYRKNAIYIFDCLSELVGDWCSDAMLGNFFMLTCPYVYDRRALAYFAILRDHHSFHVIRPIADTTQILIDVYRWQNKLYVDPFKVQHRYSPSMYTLHEWRGDEFLPVRRSITRTEILSSTSWNRTKIGTSHLGFWSSTFANAERLQALLDRGETPRQPTEEFVERLREMMISRDERILTLARQYIDLETILDIRRRMIGTGLIGGKAVGMVLARAILENRQPRWREDLEPHDSFFVGSDVFCTYVVRNGAWWLKQRQRNLQDYLDGAMEARRQIHTGTFPEYVLDQFAVMLDYFGQSPIIVRSSSLLEDAFGNAFAGKYESVFCTNQGSNEKKMEDFLAAVRTVYASTMSEKALRYRAARGLLDKDERMGLLIQRVSGEFHHWRFFPQAAGVALSFNPYVWNEEIEAEAGVTRIVFGLGTRAVDRRDDDYTRIVSLSAPDRRPEASPDEVRQHTQHKVDYLDLEANRELSRGFDEVLGSSRDIPLEMFASRDRQLEKRMKELNRQDFFPWVLTFDGLLKETTFVEDMRWILGTLQQVYGCPVDIEYTLNFFEEGRYKINLLQCRPLQTQGTGETPDTPTDIPPERIVLSSNGPIIGRSRVTNIDRVIYVVPSLYDQLPMNDRYAIARAIGRLSHVAEAENRATLILGPGRWGTTTPSLGVPISFAEINTVSVVCEMVTMGEDIVPDVSLGTHFFNDLVEANILYVAMFPNKEGHSLDEAFFEAQPNRVAHFLPEAEKLSHVLRLIDLTTAESPPLVLHANMVKQSVVCYRSSP